MLTNYYTKKILDAQTKVAAYTFPTIFLGVSSTAPIQAGTGATEPSTGGYARVTTDALWAPAALDLGAMTAATNADIFLPTSTGQWASGLPLTHLLYWDALAVGTGNLLAYSWLGRSFATAGNDGRKYFQPTDVNLTTNQIVVTGHGFVDGDTVVVRVLPGSTAPAPLVDDTFYYVNQIDANTLELHTNQALTAIVDLTTAGVGTQCLFKVLPRIVNGAEIRLKFDSTFVRLGFGDAD